MSRALSGAKVDPMSAEAADNRHEQWHEPLTTDFAIAGIDIPDRLDAQSVRNLQMDDYKRASRLSITRSAVAVWLRRILLVSLLTAMGALAWFGFQFANAQFSKEAIAARISAASGSPATLAQRQFTLFPVPGIELRDLRIGSSLRVDLVSIRLPWDGLVEAISRRRLLPEATVGPIRLSADQALDLAALGPMLSAGSSLGVGAVRFSAVTFQDMPLLPDQYEILARRQTDRDLVPLEVRQLGGRGEMRLLAVVDSAGTLRFELNAQRWAAPVVPAVVWDSLVAQGRAWPRGIVIESFSGKTAAAELQGAWAAASDVRWSAAASIQSEDADLEGVIRALAAVTSETPFRSPVRGRASFSALGSGHGVSLNDALDRSVFVGQAQARALTLTGINLGVLALQEERAAQEVGGTTRLSELTAALLWSPKGLSIRDIRGQAGGMLTRGQISVAPNLRVAGALTVDLSSVLPGAPLAQVQIGGSLTTPFFSRP